MTMINSFPDKMNLSFSGCGFLCIYHTGVAAAIKEYAPHLVQGTVSGASAGAIVAAGLICGICISQATSTILKIVTQARSRALGPLHPAFNLLALTREEIVKTLPPDAYLRCTNRLKISLTRWSDNKNVVVDEFSSNEELIDAIICSCFIPMYCGLKPPTFRGVAYIDGGFTDNQPVFDEHTVTVSPFSGESDICPPDWDSASFLGISFSGTSIRFTTRNLFRLTACLMPPSTEDCSKMCLQGFEDTLRFLTKNAMAPCIRCLTVQTNIGQPAGNISIPLDDRRTMSPMAIRTRKRSSSNLARKRYESEADTCCESEHMYNSQVNDVFPSIMRRTFDEAFAAEDSLFKYLLSFRMFRYARTALGVGKLPLDMTIIFTKNVASWLSMVAAPQWLRTRLNALVEFIYHEIDNQKSRYTRFSCHPSLFESPPEHKHKTSTPPPAIELSAEAKRELSVIRERDRRRKLSSGSSGAVAAPPIIKDWSMIGSGSTDMDGFEHLIEYTENHDAMYAFHYMDENNKMKCYELFNISDHRHRHPCHSVAGTNPTVQRPVSMVIEEKDEECSGSAELQSTNRDEVDSGLSGVEQSTSSASAGASKRDACCSPVRHFPPISGVSSSSTAISGSGSHSRTIRTKPQSKRHGSFSSNHSSGRRHQAAACIRDVVSTISSDSEVDAGERLFVPNRRLRRPSNEYDAEGSDTDIVC